LAAAVPPHDEITNTATEVDATEVSPPAPIVRLTPGSKLGRHEIGEVIGAGGMGVVYRARDPELNRDVAIKVVGARGRSQDRLLLEARAMAKLDHPSVMPVFDVGTLDEGIYVVMPFLSGGTLHDWIHAKPRPWNDVVDRFLKAGRGLAAAHAAGLVHRDFKPRNVLVDGDDVFVADFGLAANDVSSSSGEPTGASTIGGTPGYMAPEQARGENVDARADQFSFCISLWEGLTGERPQEAVTRTAGILSGVVPPIPEGRRGVPSWLLSLVARGFALRAEERWKDLATLLDRIEHRRRRPRALVLGGVGLTAIAIASVVVAMRPARGSSCPDATKRLSGVWDRAIKDRVKAALEQVAPSIATESFARFSSSLDSYADGWRATQIQACKLAREDRKNDLSDRRQLCLDRRLDALRAITTLLQDASQTSTVVRVDEALADLPRVSDCLDTASMSATQPLPSSASKRAEIEAAMKELSTVTTARLRGDMPAFLAGARHVVQTARTLQYAPLLADALVAQARAETDNRESDEGTLRELAQVAAAAHQDVQAAFAWLQLIGTLVAKGDYAGATALVPVAEAAVDRAGADVDLRFERELVLGSFAMKTERFEEAFTRFAEARAIASDARRKAFAIEFQTKTTILAKGPAAAIPIGNEALTEHEAVFGPKHPALIKVLDVLSQANVMIGDFDAAEAHARRAIEIATAIYGERHAANGTAIRVLSYIASTRGKNAEAAELARRGLAIAEESGAPETIVSALATLAEAAAAADGPAAALPPLERAVSLVETMVGKNHGMYVQIEGELAAKLVAVKRCPSALPYLEHAIAFFAVARPSETGMPLMLRAQCEEADGKLDDAERSYEKAVDVCKPGLCDPRTEGQAMAILGAFLVETKRDRARGVRLLESARRLFEEKDMPNELKETELLIEKAKARR
jgi:eukaryotic-like serine/threonine-protein kinase